MPARGSSLGSACTVPSASGVSPASFACLASSSDPTGAIGAALQPLATGCGGERPQPRRLLCLPCRDLGDCHWHTSMSRPLDYGRRTVEEAEPGFPSRCALDYLVCPASKSVKWAQRRLWLWVRWGHSRETRCRRHLGGAWGHGPVRTVGVRASASPEAKLAGGALAPTVTARTPTHSRHPALSPARLSGPNCPPSCQSLRWAWTQGPEVPRANLPNVFSKFQNHSPSRAPQDGHGIRGPGGRVDRAPVEPRSPGCEPCPCRSWCRRSPGTDRAGDSPTHGRT